MGLRAILQFMDWAGTPKIQYRPQLRFGPYNIFGVPARSINCDIAHNPMKFLLNNLTFTTLTGNHNMFNLWWIKLTQHFYLNNFCTYIMIYIIWWRIIISAAIKISIFLMGIHWHLWPCIGMCGYSLACVDIHCYVWTSIVMCDHLLPYVVIHWHL